MAIKSGQILHDINGFVIDRIQTAGPGNLNIPQEKIYELGNDNTVATIHDIPDLSFDLESFDTSCEMECIVTGKNPTSFSSTPGSNEIDFVDSTPIDVVSPFKSKKGAFDIVKGVAVPYLTLERVEYRFGLRQNAVQRFTFRGDSIYYCPGQPYYEVIANTGTGPYDLEHSAQLYVEGANNVHVLCVTLHDSTGTNVAKRVFFDDSATSGYYYTDTATGGTAGVGSFTLADDFSADYDEIHVVYSSSVKTSYDSEVGNVNPSGNAIVVSNSVKPAAVRPKDINVYLSDGAATPTWTRLTGVQSADITRSVNLQNDEEFGNPHYVGQDYETADVNGTIGFKPIDPADLLAKLYAITGVNDGEVMGPNLSKTIGMEIHINNPTTGARLKTIYCPDARFTVPGLQGRVQQKLETSLPFSSDTGQMTVYNGQRRAGDDT